MAGEGRYLGESWGCREPYHLDRWLSAMRKGSAAVPRCEAVTRLGMSCRHARMKGSKVCYWHLKEPEKSRLQAQRLPDLVRRANTLLYGEYGRDRALNAMRSLTTYQLRKAWWANPLLEGSTIALTPRDEAAVRDLLLERFAIDIDGPLPGHGHPPTNRCRDELLWVGRHHLTRRINERQLAARVRRSLRLDAAFWKRMPECEQVI